MILLTPRCLFTYSGTRKDRNDGRRGGGIAIFVKVPLCLNRSLFAIIL